MSDIARIGVRPQKALPTRQFTTHNCALEIVGYGFPYLSQSCRHSFAFRTGVSHSHVLCPPELHSYGISPVNWESYPGQKV